MYGFLRDSFCVYVSVREGIFISDPFKNVRGGNNGDNFAMRMLEGQMCPSCAFALAFNRPVTF